MGGFIANSLYRFLSILKNSEKFQKEKQRIQIMDRTGSNLTEKMLQEEEASLKTHIFDDILTKFHKKNLIRS